MDKLKSLGVCTVPPRPAPMAKRHSEGNGLADRPRLETPGSEFHSPLAQRKAVQQTSQPQEDEFYTDMHAEPNGTLVTEETYTDMQTGTEGGGTQVKQEEFYTDMDPQAESETVQDELYTAMEAEKEPEELLEPEFYADVDPAVGGNQLKVEEAGDSMDEADHPIPGNQPHMLHKPPNSCHLRPGSTGSGSIGSDSFAPESSPYAQFNGSKFKRVKASSLTSSSKAGYLEKLGGYRHNKWQKRYCVLDDICLFFFGSDKDKTQNNQLLLIDYDVATDVTEVKEKKKFLFKIKPIIVTEKSQLKTYFFRVSSEQIRDEWVAAIAEACHRGAGMGKRNTIFLQYHEQEGTPPLMKDVEPNPPSEDELYEDAVPVSESYMITPSNTSEESDSAATPVTRRKPQPTPLISEPVARGPPNLVPLTMRPDPPVDTFRIYYNDNWFNYNDVYVAKWDCQASGANELSLNRGDLVLIVEKVNVDWWYVSARSDDDDFKGKAGLVPSVYLDSAFEDIH